jgi:hypothetical protein
VQADPSTTVTFDLTNLHKWQQTDFFEMVCPNNAAFNFFFGTVGETTFTGTFPYFGALSMGSEGDQYHIAQLITQNLGGYPFTGLGRYIAPHEFTQAQGSNTPIDGMLKTIAKNVSVRRSTWLTNVCANVSSAILKDAQSSIK